MKSHLLDLFLSLLAGALYALAYPSFLGGGWFPLVLIALPIFLWKLESAGTKKSLLIVLCFNLGLNMTGYYWIPHTLREFGQLPYAVSILLGAAFCLILQPHWWVYVIWKKFRPRWQWDKESMILLTALMMTLLERFVPQQFPSFVGSPWLHLAPYLGLTPYFGVVIFSFITYWLALEVVEQLQSKKLRPQVWIVLLIFVVINGILELKKPEAKNHLSVRVVQANIGNFLKLSSETGDFGSTQSVAELYDRLSTRENGFKPELIIWPETAYPNSFYGKETQVESVFNSIMQRTGSEILIGGYDQDTSRPTMDLIESVFNASILMGEGRVRSMYHKNILIPFGETLPFGPLNRQIVSIVPAISLFARGQGTPVMETKTGYRFVTPICYEILESNYMRSLLNQWNGNHFIVNHTNDSWYGDTAEPHQHLFLSKWRALEFGLPIIRSTNTGISSVIYPDGSESRRLKVNEVDILDEKVNLSTPAPTVYQTYGAFPFMLLFALLFALTWWREKK